MCPSGPPWRRTQAGHRRCVRDPRHFRRDERRGRRELHGHVRHHVQPGDGPNGVHPVSGTIFTKGSGCQDLNITKVSATDSYAGWLENSHTGTWAACSRGFVKIAKGNAAVVLCCSVKAGTLMAAVQESNTRRTITAEY
jgi:hypothetical protein